MSTIKQNIIVYFNAFLALLVYGGWATYANYDHGPSAWVTAGLIQGAYAFVSTLSISIAALWVYNRAGQGIKGIGIGFLVSFIVMAAFPATVHTIAQTPNILLTIAPGLIWGSLYLLGLLIVTERRNTGKAPDAPNLSTKTTTA